MINWLKFSILLLPEKEQILILTLGNIVLEAKILNIDFTQIKAFIKFIQILLDFLAGKKKEYDNTIKELEDFEVIEQDINYNINNNINNKINMTKIKNDDLNNISTSPKENEIEIINIDEEEEKN